MVVGLVDVELDERIDAVINAHSAFEDLLSVQRRKVEAQVGEAREIVEAVGLGLHLRRWSLLIHRWRRRRIFVAIIDFLLAAVVLLVHRYQIWLAAHRNDVLVKDVEQRIGIDGRIGVEEVAVRLLHFQVSNRTGILVREHVHLVVVVLLNGRRDDCVRLLIVVVL